MSPLRKLSLFLWIVLSLVMAGCGPVEERWRQFDRKLDFTKILPETKRSQKVQRLDADDDGKDEWVVFYKFDLVEGATGRQFSPISAAVYNDDHGDPPVIFPYELHPPGRRYLGEQNCEAEPKDLITTNEGPELLVSCFAEEDLVVDLSVFHWYDYDKDDLLKKPSGERQGYECLGFFHGSGGITLDGSKVIVKERIEGRSQLSEKKVYQVRDDSYFQPEKGEPWPPVETSVEFAFGVPEDVTQSPYPEKVVLAFYQALGQDNLLAQNYLSERGGLKAKVGTDSFGTAARGDEIQKVLVKDIIYTPEPEREKRHDPVTISVSVASVTSAGVDEAQDKTWQVIWESPREGGAEGGWKLHPDIYPPPILLEPANGQRLGREAVSFKWAWERELAEDEHFCVEVWELHTEPTTVPMRLTRSKSLSVPATEMSLRDYQWRVTVVSVADLLPEEERPEEERLEEKRSEPSETWSFSWGSRPIITPTPTLPVSPIQRVTKGLTSSVIIKVVLILIVAGFVIGAMALLVALFVAEVNDILLEEALKLLVRPEELWRAMRGEYILSSPYVVTGPVPENMFFGRDREIEDIVGGVMEWPATLP